MPKNNARNTEDKVSALQNELESLQDELDANLLDQEELRSLERGLRERIEVLEQQLDGGSLSADDSYGE